jgi:hypothetical protein
MENERFDSLERNLNRFIHAQEMHNVRQVNFMDEQEKQNAQVLTEIATINRGVYGDEKNEVDGLHKRMKIVELAVKKWKNDRARVIAWGLGIAAGFNGAFFIIKEFLK